MKMTNEKAQRVLMQLVRYHYGLIDVPPTNIDIEEAHFFIKTQLSVAKCFEGAVEVGENSIELTVMGKDQHTNIPLNYLLTNHKLYAVPKGEK